MKKIGVLIIATNKYIQFVQPLIDSAKTHLLKGHNVHYYVFTDALQKNTEDITYIYSPSAVAFNDFIQV